MTTKTRARRRTRDTRPALPAEIVRRIEAERRRLQRASVLLRGVALGFELGRDWDFSDGADAVRVMIDEAVLALDSVALRRPVSKDD